MIFLWSQTDLIPHSTWKYGLTLVQLFFFCNCDRWTWCGLFPYKNDQINLYRYIQPYAAIFLNFLITDKLHSRQTCVCITENKVAEIYKLSSDMSFHVISARRHTEFWKTKFRICNRFFALEKRSDRLLFRLTALRAYQVSTRKLAFHIQ
jgi:hypothetical protein